MDVSSSMYFLKHLDTYHTTKPYSIDYRVKDWESGIPRSNYKSELVQDVPIRDIRGKEGEFTFDSNGFAVLEMESSMQYEDFKDMLKIERVYCQEIASCLLEYFPTATAIQIYDVEIRRRHPLFPRVEMQPGMVMQPAQRVHIDGTKRSCFEVMQELGDAAKGYKRHIFLNAWRPLKGPLYDWPLAFCDIQTVEAQDLNHHDHVFDCSVRENIMVHYNPRQQWHYLSGQLPSEILLFRQAGSDDRPGVPHSAFDLARAHKTQSDMLRESIEVRAVVCFDE